MEEEKLSIKINLADRNYPLKIAVSDEERIRAAVRLINDKVAQYRQRYADRDLHDALAMAALQFVIKLLEQEDQQDAGLVAQQLFDLDTQLAQYLQEVGK